MIKKARIEDALYDVITYEEYMRNKEIYSRYASNIAIESGGYILPVRTQTDTRPGFYPIKTTDDGTVEHSEAVFKLPKDDEEKAKYDVSNVINFSDAKNFRGVIEAQDKLNKAERSILTTADNITIPEVYDNDSPFMKAIKTAIIKKHIDLDKYAHRFGNNFPNDKRLLKKDDMTLQKGITYANCLDFDIYAIIQDTDSDVPNPIGEPIVVKLTGDYAGFTNDYDGYTQQITEAATNEPITMDLKAAIPQNFVNNLYVPEGYSVYISPTT